MVFETFRRCHRWVNGATVVVMSEAASINITFAFQQAGLFIISFGLLQDRGVIVALLRRLHRSQVKEVYTSVACDIGDMF